MNIQQNNYMNIGGWNGNKQHSATIIFLNLYTDSDLKIHETGITRISGDCKKYMFTWIGLKYF